MRLRTDLRPLDRNFSGSTFSAPATMSGSESNSSVPWCRMRVLYTRWAVPETFRPSTRISLRPEASACNPSEASASTTGAVKRSSRRLPASSSVMNE